MNSYYQLNFKNQLMNRILFQDAYVGWMRGSLSLSLSLSLGPLHTQDWEPMTVTLQALLLVEKVKPVQVQFTLRLKDQWSMWMQDRCKSSHGFLHGTDWIIFHGHLDYFQKPPLGSRPNTKPGRLRHYKRLQPVVYSILPCVRTCMNKNSLK